MSHALVRRANAVVLGMLVVILLLVGGATWDQINRARSARAWSQHADDVISATKDLGLALGSAETGQRGYLLTGRDDYLAPYQAALERVSLLQGELQHLSMDSDAMQAQLRALSPVVQRKLVELALTVHLRRTAGFAPALAVVQTDVGRLAMTRIEAILTVMTTDEEILLRQRLAAANARGHVVRWMMLAGIVWALAALLWAARMLNQAWKVSLRLETEQRIVASHLRASLDGLSQGVGVFDAGWRLANWNDCFRLLLDLPDRLLRPGTRYAELVDHTTTGGSPLLESEAVTRAVRVTPQEPVVYERGGSHGRQLELRRCPMPDGGFVLTVTDMTRRAQAETALREAQKMQAIGQLTGGIAHDFNNLLTVILGNLELIQARLPDDAPLQARIDRATRAAQRGASLTSQLLAFARRQSLVPDTIDVAATMRELVPMLRRTLGAHIEIHAAGAELWPAMADPAQLESAVLNLALNARDAMPGGGRLTIGMANTVLDESDARADHEVVPGDYIMVVVSDSGHGMAPDVLARVFEPFFTTKPDGKGTGLGLAMVFGFVKQSGGHVKIESRLGGGTRVRLYLPRATGLSGAALPAAGAAAGSGTPRGTATVLLVEDEPAVREVTAAILSDLGYRVLEAPDGEAALQLFEGHEAAIDLLLTDVLLPGRLNGPDLARRVVAARPAVKVLYMSGCSDPAVLLAGRVPDRERLIGKPFARDELAGQVAKTLGRPVPGGAARVIELRPRLRD